MVFQYFQCLPLMYAEAARVLSCKSYSNKTTFQNIFLFFMAHGNCINEFFRQMLQHTISIPLCESHSWRLLFSLSLYPILHVNRASLKCIFCIGWESSLSLVSLFVSLITCLEDFYTFTTSTVKIMYH